MNCFPSQVVQPLKCERVVLLDGSAQINRALLPRFRAEIVLKRPHGFLRGLYGAVVSTLGAEDSVSAKRARDLAKPQKRLLGPFDILDVDSYVLFVSASPALHDSSS